MSNVRPVVVILNMHYSGLGLARNLAHLGVSVVGLGSNARFPGNFTKHCRYLAAPDSRDQGDELCRFLLDLAPSLGGDRPVLFPTRDHDIHFINARREALEKAFRLAFPPRAILDETMNKDKLYAVAATCGIDRPRTLTLDGAESFAAQREKMPFPCIVKPVYSSQWRKPGIWEAVGRQKVAVIRSMPEFETFYARLSAFDPLVNVQEVIPGPETNLVVFGSYADAGSRVVNYFTGFKRLQYPPLYGTGLVVEAGLVPDIVERSRDLIRALRLTGISEIEYKRDERTGRYYLIEINTRHWDQHALGAACGVNLTETAYLDLIGEVPPRYAQSPRSIKWVAEADMAFRFLNAARRGPGPVLELARLVRGPKTYSVWDPSDPKPGLVQATNILRDAMDFARAWIGRRLPGKRGAR